MYATWIELNRLRAQQMLKNEFVQRDCTRIQCQKDRETHNVFVGKSKAVFGRRRRYMYTTQAGGYSSMSRSSSSCFFFTFHYFHK